MPDIETAKRCGRWFGRLLWVLLIVHAPAYGESSDIRTLLMPGPLVEGHAKEENNCAACHESFGKEAQSRLCLDCHKEVASDIDAGGGFHGQGVTAGASCTQCHGDHQGREANITALDRERFDHAKTDFPLLGAHRGEDCAGCHVNGKKWREASRECVGCHREDDRHKNRMGSKCADCHQESSWAEVRFDHGSTDFTLRGKHEQVSCAACHPDERYEGTPQQCYACHAISDAHRGKRGEDCASCHSETSWKKISFDHAAVKAFPLRGAHTKTGCSACHHLQKFEDTLGTACIDCHRSDDVHGGRNGAVCSDCHGESSWKKARFDHDADTDFALRGKHAQVKCDACHFSNARETETPVECNACHAESDVHKGAQGSECGICHREEGWLEIRHFDHDIGRFPLLGMHAGLSCESCHLDKAYADTADTCVDCHAGDDRHEGELGKDCAQCHNPAGWSLWRFDHDSQTDFALSGAHRDIQCADCHHEPAATEKLSGACYDCHRSDDRHRGAFGRDCVRCHVTDRFDNVRMTR